MLELLLVLLLLFYASHVHGEIQPSGVTIVEPIFVRYCPFQAKVSLTTNSTSLDIEFSTKNADPGPSPLGDHRCYIRININFDKTVYAYTINEVQYVQENASSISGRVETKVAWEYDHGPTQFTPVTLSSTSSSQTARNTTYASGAGCQDELPMNILISFDANEVGRVSTAGLKLRAKLQWRVRTYKEYWFEDKFCLGLDDCRSVDVDGVPSRLGSCTYPNGTV